MNCNRSVLFWLNLSLAEMLKDQLEDAEDNANIFYCLVSGKKQVDVTSFEETKLTSSGTLV